jgi:3-oxosteroid 1-dehydrogenase
MPDWNEVYDFVVVGSGAGSMVSGMVMRQAGKSVLILEKEPLVGGTTARSGGVMWIPNNPLMQQDGVADSPEQALLYLESIIDPARSPASTSARRKTFVTEGPKMISFLMGQGVKFRRFRYWPDYFDECPGAVTPGRSIGVDLFDASGLGPWADKLSAGYTNLPIRLDEAQRLGSAGKRLSGKIAMLTIALRSALAALLGKRWMASGRALQARLLHAALEVGVEVRLSAPVSELVVENGAVVGVAATIDGKPVRIKAQMGVLLNAGGFARNQRMRDTYMPGTSVDWTVAGHGDTGEMIEEAMRIGAATAQMSERVGNQVTVPPNHKSDFLPMVQSNVNKPRAILVDQTGVRYMNEGGSYVDFARNVLERNKVAPAVPSYMIVDQQYLSDYMLADTLPGSPKRKAWERDGYLKRGATIRELAANLGMDPGTLQQTVARFNAFAHVGKDEDFGRGGRAYDRWLGDANHKPNETLGPIETGPYYALPIYPGDVGTFGGVMTDERARVLREDGSIISGLYATGAATASVMGQTYAGAGSSIGPTMTWGYVAARHALGANDY